MGGAFQKKLVWQTTKLVGHTPHQLYRKLRPCTSLSILNGSSKFQCTEEFGKRQTCVFVTIHPTHPGGSKGKCLISDCFKIRLRSWILCRKHRRLIGFISKPTLYMLAMSWGLIGVLGLGVGLGLTHQSPDRR